MIDCGFGNDSYLYITVLWSGIYYGVIECKNNEIINSNKKSSILEYTTWQEINWHSQHEALTMTNLSNDEVFALLSNFSTSPTKTKIFTMIDAIKKP